MRRAMRELQAGTPDSTDDFFRRARPAAGLRRSLQPARPWRASNKATIPAPSLTSSKSCNASHAISAPLQNLSHIAEDHGDWKGAYAAWQKVIDIDPKTPDGAKRLADLKRRAFGDET